MLGYGGNIIIDPSNVYKNNEVVEQIPQVVKGCYESDYNIISLDSIIKKKLEQEKKKIPYMRAELNKLKEKIKGRQKIIERENTIANINNLTKEIQCISTGEKIKEYINKTEKILEAYKFLPKKPKIIMFGKKVEQKEMDDDTKKRLHIIENFLDKASDYIQLELIRKNNIKMDTCSCGESLSKLASNDDGLLICPNEECGIVHNVVITSKMPKDGSRVSSCTSQDDDSIENFMRAFTRYQGLQTDKPKPELYKQLDDYFVRHGRPKGEIIRQMPLDPYTGRRGDTNHQMLLFALFEIGQTCYYEHSNLIGHIYWGWELPQVSQYKDRIISDYLKTQKVFRQIPMEEKNRTSSLGTQFRLWRHLQLAGHNCSMDEFKIAENTDSINNHNRLWKLMCDGANDPNIYYIE